MSTVHAVSVEDESARSTPSTAVVPLGQEHVVSVLASVQTASEWQESVPQLAAAAVEVSGVTVVLALLTRVTSTGSPFSVVVTDVASVVVEDAVVASSRHPAVSS